MYSLDMTQVVEDKEDDDGIHRLVSPPLKLQMSGGDFGAADLSDNSHRLVVRSLCVDHSDHGNTQLHDDGHH